MKYTKKVTETTEYLHGTDSSGNSCLVKTIQTTVTEEDDGNDDK